MYTAELRTTALTDPGITELKPYGVTPLAMTWFLVDHLLLAPSRLAPLRRNGRTRLVIAHIVTCLDFRGSSAFGKYRTRRLAPSGAEQHLGADVQDWTVVRSELHKLSARSYAKKLHGGHKDMLTALLFLQCHLRRRALPISGLWTGLATAR